ncbi:MAG: RlmE family RNA methyltransferase [Bauldia sp.]|nr:RlmE family RNA methyltransferase [Bauldia sp.]
MAESGRGGGRSLKVRVKTARRRTASSTRWLERQLNDPYVARAQQEGYRARSAYKLIEIDDRFPILARGKRVVDLGAAPGGWCQVAAARVGSTATAPLVVGIDLLPVEPIAGVVLLEKDFLADDAPAAILAALGAAPDVVLSDMAAATTGHRRTDQLRTAQLAEAAAAFAMESLRPGGHFLTKVFQGGTEGALLAELKRNFASVVHVKPKASRQESVELYLLARGFRGRPQAD